MATMNAWVCRAYGRPEVLAMEQRPLPRPRDDEILVRVRATTVSAGDARIRAMRLPAGFGAMGRLAFGIRRPRQPVLGIDFAGTVEAVGRLVTDWTPGDEIVGMNGSAMRCHAEFVAVGAHRAIARKPAGLSFESAVSLCFGGTTALHFLRRADLRPGDTVRVIGASGAVGSAMMQLAKARGARVTAVTSERNAELVRSLGAVDVIAYDRESPGARAASYDVVADTVDASSFRDCLPMLAEGGRYLGVAAGLRAQFVRRVGTRRSISGVAEERAADIAELMRLAGDGAVRPVIDSVYAFSDLQRAHARVDTGRKRGSVVVSVG